MVDRRVFISVQISSHLPGGAVRGREVSAAIFQRPVGDVIGTWSTVVSVDSAAAAAATAAQVRSRARACVCDGVNPRDSLRHNTCPSARPAAAAAALTSYTPAALDTTTTTTDSDNASDPFHVRAVAVAASTDESLDPHGPRPP